MSAKRIDGKAFAEGLRARIGAVVTDLKATHGLTPGLAVVIVGDDPASHVYVSSKAKQTAEADMASFKFQMDADTPETVLLAKVDEFNNDPAVHGILVQLPLPGHIDDEKVINTINPDKDVDGFHVINAGRLAIGQDSMVPCTPFGCILMARETLGSLSGLNAVVVGRSNIVGKPMAQLLLAESCTVTIAHSRTKDLPAVCREADILVAAIGRPEMIRGDWIKPGATVLDVGINRINAPERGEDKTRLVGDVAYDEAAEIAGAITPVPGGVGPMTIACLLRNTLVAACRQAGLPEPQVDISA